MKKIYILSIISGALCLAVSCTKEVQLEDSATEGNEMSLVTETITATISEADSKVAIDGTTGDVSWHFGEEVAYYTSSGWASADNKNDDGPVATFITEGTRSCFAVFPKSLVYDGSAYYEASISNHGQSGSSLDVVLPYTYALADIQNTKTQLPIIADNNGSEWSFKQLCGILRLTVNNIPSGTSYLKVDFNGRKVSGPFSIASTVSAGFSVIASKAGTPGSDDYIKITGFSGSEGSVTVNIPLPTGTPYQDLIISAWNGDDKPLLAQVTPFSYTGLRAHGKKISSKLTLGVFSLTSDPTYCVFAPGVLQAVTTDGSNWTWKFADEQYDVFCDFYNPSGESPDAMFKITEGNKLINGSGTASGACTVDLFGWSTNLHADFGINNSTNNADYVGSFVDWGTNVIGEYSSGTWKVINQTVSRIFDGDARTTERFVPAIITGVTGHANGIPGLILLPDIYEHPAGFAPFQNVNSGTGYGDNSYTAAEWKQLEDAGCSFWPMGGARNGHPGRMQVWLANSSNESKVYQFEYNFNSGTVRNWDLDDRKIGKNVRLIRIVQ